MTGRRAIPRHPSNPVNQPSCIALKSLENLHINCVKCTFFVLCFLFCPNTFTRPRRGPGPVPVPVPMGCTLLPVRKWQSPPTRGVCVCVCVLTTWMHHPFVCGCVCRPSLLRSDRSIPPFIWSAKANIVRPNFTQKMQSNVTLFIIPAIYIFQPGGRNGIAKGERQWKRQKLKSIKLNCLVRILNRSCLPLNLVLIGIKLKKQIID